MVPNPYALARRALFLLPPEDAHELTLKTLERSLFRRAKPRVDTNLHVRLAGLDFPNPLGIAAGFDKDARVPDGVLGLGCGFAEIGTVTPLPQSGNSKPRIFRLIEDNGVINRLGFNSAGHAAALRRLRRRQPSGIVGVNIGANKETPDRTGDYVLGLETFYDVASYFTVNISSPNTPGLRDLQAPAALDELLGRVMAARAARVSRGQPKRPVFVKIAPDIASEDIPAITERLTAHGVDAIAISNTTLARDGLKSPLKAEAGGLSGRPLFERSTIMLARVHQATCGRIPLIGIGGIDSAETALAKIEAGASLIQLYTGLIYEGPQLIQRILDGLADAVARSGSGSLTALTGTRAAAWAERPLTS